MTDNFEKDINVPSKRLDRIDKMEIDLANYEQMERDIEKVIEPYQLNWELDCLNLPSAIQSILERKEQELEQETALKETYLACYKAKHEDIEGELFKLREYKKSKQASYEALQKRCNELELENRKLKQALQDIKSICLEQNLKADFFACEVLQKISEVLDE